MQLFAEIGYGHDDNREHLKKRFKTCTNEDADDFLALDLLDDLGQNEILANPSQYLLWQDILLGLTDKHAEGQNTDEHYAEVSRKMREYADKSISCKGIFEYSYYLSRVLEIRTDLGNKLKNYYDNKDRTALKNVLDITLPELELRIIEFKNVFRKLWFDTYKPFGWEVMDMRIGTLLSRIETAELRIEQYLNGKINEIEELEEERLYYKLDDWVKSDCKDLNLRTVTYLKYAAPGNSSMGYYD